MRHRHAEHLGDPLQPAGRDAVRALFVFLHLLERHADELAELGLRQSALQAQRAHALPDLSVAGISASSCHFDLQWMAPIGGTWDAGRWGRPVRRERNAAPMFNTLRDRNYGKNLRPVMSYNTPAEKTFDAESVPAERVRALDRSVDVCLSNRCPGRFGEPAVHPRIESEGRLRRNMRYGWKSIGIGGSSRMSVMVTRRLAAM
jgi:hypothetical protein